MIQTVTASVCILAPDEIKDADSRRIKDIVAVVSGDLASRAEKLLNEFGIGGCVAVVTEPVEYGGSPYGLKKR